MIGRESIYHHLQGGLFESVQKCGHDKKKKKTDKSIILSPKGKAFEAVMHALTNKKTLVCYSDMLTVIRPISGHSREDSAGSVDGPKRSIPQLRAAVLAEAIAEVGATSLRISRENGLD